MQYSLYSLFLAFVSADDVRDHEAAHRTIRHLLGAPTTQDKVPTRKEDDIYIPVIANLADVLVTPFGATTLLVQCVSGLCSGIPHALLQRGKFPLAQVLDSVWTTMQLPTSVCSISLGRAVYKHPSARCRDTSSIFFWGQ